MFPFLLVCFLAPLGLGLYPLFQGGAADVRFLLLALAPGLGVAWVVRQWLIHPGAVRDYTQGGVVGFEETPYHLRWFDWAIFMTRVGTIEKGSGVLRLQRKLFFGLIPLATVERSVSEFYRVEVSWDRVERTRGERHRRYTEVVRIDYNVRLVDRSADGLNILDLSMPVSSRRGPEFIETFREALEGIFGAPGDRRRRTREPLDEQPGGDDFEAWRAEREQGGGD